VDFREKAKEEAGIQEFGKESLVHTEAG